MAAGMLGAVVGVAVMAGAEHGDAVDVRRLEGPAANRSASKSAPTLGHVGTGMEIEMNGPEGKGRLRHGGRLPEPAAAGKMNVRHLAHPMPREWVPSSSPAAPGSDACRVTPRAGRALPGRAFSAGGTGTCLLAMRRDRCPGGAGRRAPGAARTRHQQRAALDGPRHPARAQAAQGLPVRSIVPAGRALAAAAQPAPVAGRSSE